MAVTAAYDGSVFVSQGYSCVEYMKRACDEQPGQESARKAARSAEGSGSEEGVLSMLDVLAGGEDENESAGSVGCSSSSSSSDSSSSSSSGSPSGEAAVLDAAVEPSASATVARGEPQAQEEAGDLVDIPPPKKVNPLNPQPVLQTTRSPPRPRMRRDLALNSGVFD